MSDDMFTEEDAENDGLIKREAGQQLNSVMSRKGGELYRMFLEWCEQQDRDPSVVLGDMVLRAMRDSDYAREVSETVVNVGQLKKQDIREDDLELVTDLMDKFADEDDSGEDPIDKLVKKRIESAGGSPMSALTERREPRGGNNDRRVQELEREIQRLRQQVDQGQQQQQTNDVDDTVEVNSESSKSIDDLFDNGGSDGGTDTSGVSDSESGDTVSDPVDDDDDSSGEQEEIEMTNMGHDDSGETEVPFGTDEAEEEAET